TEDRYLRLGDTHQKGCNTTDHVQRRAPHTRTRPTARVLPMPGGTCGLPRQDIHERKSNIAKIHDPVHRDASRLTVIGGPGLFFQVTGFGSNGRNEPRLLIRSKYSSGRILIFACKFTNLDRGSRSFNITLDEPAPAFPDNPNGCMLRAYR